MIVQDKKTKKWILYTRDGSRILGTHKTRKQALRQERAIQWSQSQRENPYVMLDKDGYVINPETGSNIWYHGSPDYSPFEDIGVSHQLSAFYLTSSFHLAKNNFGLNKTLSDLADDLFDYDKEKGIYLTDNIGLTEEEFNDFGENLAKYAVHSFRYKPTKLFDPDNIVQKVEDGDESSFIWTEEGLEFRNKLEWVLAFKHEFRNAKITERHVDKYKELIFNFSFELYENHPAFLYTLVDLGYTSWLEREDDLDPYDRETSDLDLAVLEPDFSKIEFVQNPDGSNVEVFEVKLLCSKCGKGPHGEGFLIEDLLNEKEELMCTQCRREESEIRKNPITPLVNPTTGGYVWFHGSSTGDCEFLEGGGFHEGASFFASDIKDASLFTDKDDTRIARICAVEILLSEDQVFDAKKLTHEGYINNLDTDLTPYGQRFVECIIKKNPNLKDRYYRDTYLIPILHFLMEYDWTAMDHRGSVSSDARACLADLGLEAWYEKEINVPALGYTDTEINIGVSQPHKYVRLLGEIDICHECMSNLDQLSETLYKCSNTSCEKVYQTCPDCKKEGILELDEDGDFVCQGCYSVFEESEIRKNPSLRSEYFKDRIKEHTHHSDDVDDSVWYRGAKKLDKDSGLGFGILGNGLYVTRNLDEADGYASDYKEDGEIVGKVYAFYVNPDINVMDTHSLEFLNIFSAIVKAYNFPKEYIDKVEALRQKAKQGESLEEVNSILDPYGYRFSTKPFEVGEAIRREALKYGYRGIFSENPQWGLVLFDPESDSTLLGVVEIDDMAMI